MEMMKEVTGLDLTGWENQAQADGEEAEKMQDAEAQRERKDAEMPDMSFLLSFDRSLMWDLFCRCLSKRRRMGTRLIQQRRPHPRRLQCHRLA